MTSPFDPSYEPERSEEQWADPSIPPPDPQKNVMFAILQKYVKVNLVRPNRKAHHTCGTPLCRVNRVS
jgi:hypothetical protein